MLQMVPHRPSLLRRKRNVQNLMEKHMIWKSVKTKYALKSALKRRN